MLADKLLFHFLLLIFHSLNSLIGGTKEPSGSYSLKLLGNGRDSQLPVSHIILRGATGATWHAMFDVLRLGTLNSFWTHGHFNIG